MIPFSRIFKYVLTIFSLGIIFSMHSQINLIDDTRIVLPSVDNYRTVIDKNNVVWICSENGLTRFNFDNSRLFQIADGLPTNDIWQLYSDKFERLWLYHKENGIFFIKNDSVHMVRGSENLRETFVVADINDTIFFKAFGFFDYDNIGETYFYTKDGVFGSCSLKGGRKHVLGGRNLVSEYREVGDRLWRDEDGIKYCEYNSFSYGNVTTDDLPNILYQSGFNSDGSDRLLTYEFNGVKKLSDIISTNFSQTIAIPNSNEYIIEVNDSLRFYENIALNRRNLNIEKVLLPFYEKYGTNFNFSKDVDENIWVTIHRGTVHFIPKSYYELSTFLINDSSLHNSLEKNYVEIKNIDHKLYTFSRNSIIQQLDIQSSKLATIGSSINLKDIKVYDKYIAWSNSEGVIVYNTETGLKKNMYLGERVVSFDFLDSNIIYTNNGYCFNILKGEITKQTKLNGDIEYILIDNYKIFTYQKNQLIILDRTTFMKEKFMKVDNVIKLERVGENYISYLLEDNGALLYDNLGNKIGHYFKGVSINKIIKYHESVIAVSDDNIFHAELVNGKLIVNNVRSFETHLHRINLTIQSATRYKNYLVLGLNNGIYYFQIEDIMNKINSPPMLHFSGVVLNNEETRRLNNLKYSDRNISFKFNAYSYGSFGNVILKYKLVGVDNDWNESESQNVNFSSLPSGDFFLKVIAVADELESDPKIISFSVSKPFWKNYSFIILCVFSVIIILFQLFRVILRFRERNLNRRNLFLELEFKSLKAQLNPHFIFNSMNSIQTIIHRKNEIEANEYIVSFSKLMRTLLDNSRAMSISLIDEIEFLKNFVYLSSQKINDQISLVVSLDNVKNPEKVFIRNMILQPFIENAVLHGLTNKIGEKKINLTFEEVNKDIVVSIIDNGVGRQASTILNKKNRIKHSSLSTTILKEKSKLLKDMKQEELSFEIIDLFNDGTPIGTKVVVRMKIFR